MKGYSKVSIIVGFILALMMMLVMTGTAKGMIENTGEAAQGCSMLSSILADMFGNIGGC